MNCDEVRDLTGAYALGSATDEERRLVEQHLRECDLHPEIAGLSAAALGLPAAAPEMEPPAGLGARIADAVRAAGVTPARDAAPAPAVFTPASAASGKGGLVRRAAWPVAAVLAIAVAALAAWNLALQLDDDAPEIVHFFREDDGDWLRVEGRLGRPESAIAIGGLEPLTGDRVYQLWAVRGETAIDLGVFDADPEGNWSGSVGIPLERGDRLAITEEARGGSDAPTAEPLLSTRL